MNLFLCLIPVEKSHGHLVRNNRSVLDSLKFVSAKNKYIIWDMKIVKIHDCENVSVCGTLSITSVKCRILLNSVNSSD